MLNEQRVRLLLDTPIDIIMSMGDVGSIVDDPLFWNIKSMLENTSYGNSVSGGVELYDSYENFKYNVNGIEMSFEQALDILVYCSESISYDFSMDLISKTHFSKNTKKSLIEGLKEAKHVLN